MQFFKYLFSLSLLTSSIFLFSCNGDDNLSQIPYAYVNLRIDLNDPRYIDLNPYGGYIYVNGHGNKGLIIYHDYDDSYRAIERNCSYEPSNPCARVEVESNNFGLICGETVNGTFVKCCGSTFFWDCYPKSGPALYSLVEYQVQVTGNLLTVSN